jgi:hypothetical protein
MLFFIGTYVPLLILFGSVETYILSYRFFHNVLGDPGLLHDLKNRDGLRGAVANLIRYFFGNLSLSVDGATQQSGLSEVLQERCQHVLHFFHLKDVGYESHFNDKNMRFVKAGIATASDFGLPGAISMVTSAVLLLRFRSAPATAFTAAAGVLSLILISWGIAWMEWNARFLCLAFVLFGIAFSLAMFSNPTQNRKWQAMIGFLVIWSALSFPFLTFNAKPSDLSAVFFDREKLQFSEQPPLRAVYDRVLQLESSAPETYWFVVPGSPGSWTLPFLTLPRFTWRSSRDWSAIVDWEKRNPRKSAYILVIQRPYQNELSADIVNAYPELAVILKIPASAL